MTMTEARPRRARAPAETREAILRAARQLLARDGPERMSVSEVATLAGVNRGTAYQHFATREKLVEATLATVSDTMFRAIYGEAAGDPRIEEVDVAQLTRRLIDFAMDHPELCRVWLLQILASPDPAADPFWRAYAGSLQRFVDTDRAEEGIDTVVLSVITLAGAVLWPVWAGSHARSNEERGRLAERYAREMLRLSMYGTLRSNRFPDIAAQLGRAPSPPPLRAIGG